MFQIEANTHVNGGVQRGGNVSFGEIGRHLRSEADGGADVRLDGAVSLEKKQGNRSYMRAQTISSLVWGLGT